MIGSVLSIVIIALTAPAGAAQAGVPVTFRTIARGADSQVDHHYGLVVACGPPVVAPGSSLSPSSRRRSLPHARSHGVQRPTGTSCDARSICYRRRYARFLPTIATS